MLARLEALVRPLALSGFGACAEVIASPNALGAPGVEEADLVARAESWWQLLPPQSRWLMLGVFAGMELAGPLLLGRIGRFSRVPLERRMRLVDGWRTSSLWPLRLLADAVKSPVVMMYVSHPATLAWLGATTCEHPFPSRGSLPVRRPMGDGGAS